MKLVYLPRPSSRVSNFSLFKTLFLVLFSGLKFHTRLEDSGTNLPLESASHVAGYASVPWIRNGINNKRPSLKTTAKAPENEWSQDGRFFLRGGFAVEF